MAAINAEESYDLTLDSVDKNYLRAGLITSSENNMGALVCNSINIIGDELEILGAPTIQRDANGNALPGGHGIFGGGALCQCLQ